MLMGLVPQTSRRMPNPWQYGLGGLASLEAVMGLAADLPPIGLCKDQAGNTVDCGASGGGTAAGPCDPSLVQSGYSCYVQPDGTVVYAPGDTGIVSPPPGSTPAPGGTGSAGAATGAGTGAKPVAGGCPAGQVQTVHANGSVSCSPAPSKTPAWVIWALAGAVLLLGAKAVS